MKTFAIENDHTSLVVSRVIFGTTYLGNLPDPGEAYRQMDRYFELGGRCIDTARIYSNLEPDDRYPSEKRIGEWLRRSGVRKEVVLSTKGGHPPFGRMEDCRLSRRDLWQDLEESLDALQTDYIDLYWLHRDNAAVTVAEVIDTLNEFVDQGLVRCIGFPTGRPAACWRRTPMPGRQGKPAFPPARSSGRWPGVRPRCWETKRWSA